MARKKVKLAYIINQAKRNASYKKRKSGFLKKVTELSTLCGVEACAIIYGENDAQPEVWPRDLRTRTVLDKFFSLPELKKTKNMLDLEGFLKKSIVKSQNLLRKQIEQNKKEFDILIRNVSNNLNYNIGDMNINEFNNLSGFIDTKLNEVNQKLSSMKIQAQAEVGSGIEAINGMANISHDADVQGLHETMNYGMQSVNQHLLWDFSMVPFQAQEEVGNGPEAITGIANIGYNADVQGLQETMNYGVQSDNQHLSWDFSMFPFQAREEVGNGFETMNGITNISGNANVQGLQEAMNYDMQSDNQHLPRDSSMLPFQVQENVGNEIEAINGIANISHNVYVQGLPKTVNYGMESDNQHLPRDFSMLPFQVQENVGNGIEAINGIANISHNVDVQGLPETVNYGMQSDNKHLSWDFSMLPFHDVNT